MPTYYASHISDNILVTPPVGRVGNPGDVDYQPGAPGWLICKDVVLARTGFQRYKIGDLNQEQAAKLGVDLSDPYAYIDLYRPQEEVHSAATIASFEGVPVTDSHPDDFVARDTWREVACGHVQNVRAGAEPLDDGNMPLLGDLFINVDPLAENVEQARKRQVSCGYEYALAREGEKILQVNIRGNHVAVVDKGRAGPEARIYDSADPNYPPTLTAADLWEQPPVEAAPKQGTKPDVRQSKKGVYTMTNVRSIVAHVFGRGLKQFAADDTTDPEMLTAAYAAAGKAFDAEESEEEKAKRKKEAEDAAEEKSALEKRAKDAEEKFEEMKKAKDAAEGALEKLKKEQATDAAEPQHHMPCKVKDCMDRDCRMHGALDSILEAHPKEEGEDADMKELGELFQEFLNEEGREPEHQGGGDDELESGVIEPPSEQGGLDTEEEKEKEKMAAKDAVDSKAFLMRIRPMVAKSNDKALVDDWNARWRRVAGVSRASSGTYSGFARAAGKGQDSKSASSGRPNYDAYQKHLDEVRLGKSKTQEVK